MATQQPDKLPAQANRRKKLFQRMLVIATVIIIAIAITIIWILSSLNIISRSWATISSIIITVLGVVFAFLQSLHLFFPPDKHESSVALEPSPFQQIPSTFVQPTHRGIVGLPPPTDPRPIQQRQNVVEEVYTKLTQPGITAIALTGIGGVGKSTLAALLYNYTKEQHHAQKGSFLAEALWLTVDPAVTFADLAGTLFEALGKPLPDLGNLAPQNQAVALFNALNTTDKPRLVILDQFENLLDWETGHALTDRPGVGEWLDIINSKQCTCRILLTSRPRPVGTREFPSTYMQEYPVRGLEVAEAMELLQNQGVKGTDEELKNAVVRCSGHAFSLILLASLIRDHSISLTALFKDPTLWTGDIATNLLDQIYTLRLSDVQRKLLQAFSVYREPVPLEAPLAVIKSLRKSQMLAALDTLLTQHLLEAVGEGRYQLHAIIADHAQSRFEENSEQDGEETLQTAHTRAAQFYLQLAAKTCPPREQRRRVIDVHDLIEAVWQYCQAGKRQEAYDLMRQEGLFTGLKRYGGNAILLELLLPLEEWSLKSLQAADIYNNLGDVSRVFGQMVKSRKYYELALCIFKEVENRVGEGEVLNNLGRVYYDLGNKVRAREYYEQALKICKEVGARATEGVTLNYLGRIYDNLGQQEQAQECFKQALSIYREIGDRGGEGWTLYSLGRIYNRYAPNPMQKEVALKYCQQALSILREVGDREKEGWALNYLGRAFNALGQNERARKFYEEALSIVREVGDRRAEGWTFNNLGKVCADLLENERAEKYYKEALSIVREVDDRWGEGNILNNLGWVNASLGKTQQAREYYERASSVRRDVGDRWGEDRALKNLGRIYILLGQTELAVECLTQALRICKELADGEGEAKTLHNIGILYFQEHRFDVTLASFLLARNIFDELQSQLIVETQKQIDTLHETLGDEQFTALLAQVEPQAQQIVDQALRERL